MQCDISGVILDVDGTLIDSNDAHARAWTRALQEHGLQISFSQVRPLIGMGGDLLVRKLAPELEQRGKARSLKDAHTRIFTREYLPDLKPFPRVRELISRMKQEGFSLAIATSASERDLENLLEKIGVGDLVKKTTSSDDAEISKPAPDIVEAALERLQIPSEQVLMLGDTPYDIQAASAAGVGTVALRCGGWSDHDLREAVAIYTDAEDLYVNFERSPFLIRRAA